MVKSVLWAFAPGWCGGDERCQAGWFLDGIRVEEQLWVSDHYWAFPGDSEGKESACNEGDSSSIPGLRRPPREGNGTLHMKTHSIFLPRESHGQRNLVGKCPPVIHGVVKSWTRLSD